MHSRVKLHSYTFARVSEISHKHQISDNFRYTSLVVRKITSHMPVFWPTLHTPATRVVV